MTDAFQIDQRNVTRGARAGTLFSLLFCYAGYTWFPWTPSGLGDLAGRLGYALRCELFAVLPLMAGIVMVSRKRFANERAIDGSLDAPGSQLDIHRRYVQNTTEQTLMLVIIHLALAAVLSAEAMRIIPVLVALFVIARIAFWVGYLMKPVYRAFGYATTSLPILGAFLYAAYRALS